MNCDYERTKMKQVIERLDQMIMFSKHVLNNADKDGCAYKVADACLQIEQEIRVMVIKGESS